MESKHESFDYAQDRVWGAESKHGRQPDQWLRRFDSVAHAITLSANGVYHQPAKLYLYALMLPDARGGPRPGQEIYGTALAMRGGEGRCEIELSLCCS